MTGSQYKNIIHGTLTNGSLEGVTDSVVIARKIFDNCGVPLPEGDCLAIKTALESEDFVGWRSCTVTEAQGHADNGIASIGITSNRIVIMDPREDGMTISAEANVIDLSNPIDTSSNAVIASALDASEESEMVFFANTEATTTEEYFRISGKPANNTMIVGETKTLGIETNLQGIGIDIVWSSSNTSVATVSPSIGSVSTVVTAKSEGSTVITVNSPYLGRSDSFTLTVNPWVPYYRITGKPTNNTMVVGDTKTVNLDSNIPNAEMDTQWLSSIQSVATLSPSYGSSTSVITALAPGSTRIIASNQSHLKSDEFTLVVKNPIQIYISPANHKKWYAKLDGTYYPDSVWNEKKNMEIVANALCTFLDDYHVDVYLTDIHNADGQYTGRPEEANQWITNKEKGLYLALHSNAAGNPPNISDRRGATGFYNGLGQTESLSEAFADAINLILPPNGVTVFKKSHNISLGELRLPNDDGIPAIILENSFHDNPEQANWLINNQTYLAETIGGVLVSFYNLKHK